MIFHLATFRWLSRISFLLSLALNRFFFTWTQSTRTVLFSHLLIIQLILINLTKETKVNDIPAGCWMQNTFIRLNGMNDGWWGSRWCTIRCKKGRSTVDTFEICSGITFAIITICRRMVAIVGDIGHKNTIRAVIDSAHHWAMFIFEGVRDHFIDSSRWPMWNDFMVMILWRWWWWWCDGCVRWIHVCD